MNIPEELNAPVLTNHLCWVLLHGDEVMYLRMYVRLCTEIRNQVVLCRWKC